MLQTMMQTLQKQKNYLQMPVIRMAQDSQLLNT